MRAELAEATSPEDLAEVRRLFCEYADALGVDLSFQGFAEEIAELPGRYARPRGMLMLAWRGASAVGCVGLRPLGADVCEMKRLYVSPVARGSGLGRILATAIVEAAREIGYDRMRLDTLPQMGAAIGLYRSLGFTEIAPYTGNPVPGALFLELELR